MNALQWFLLALAVACTVAVIRHAIQLRRTMKRIPRTPRVSDLYTHSGVRPRRNYERYAPTKSHDVVVAPVDLDHSTERDRKSTRLNSSHLVISYAVFCLKKKINN